MAKFQIQSMSDSDCSVGARQVHDEEEYDLIPSKEILEKKRQKRALRYKRLKRGIIALKINK